MSSAQAAFQTYDVSLPANGSVRLPVSGQNFLIWSATGRVNVRGAFGYLRGIGVGQGASSVDFTELTIEDVSGVANSVNVIVSAGSFVNQQIILSSSSALALDSATQDGIKKPLAATGFYATNSQMSAGVAEAIFSPSSNINGAILLQAAINFTTSAVAATCCVLAKSSAPASVLDGEVLVCTALAQYYSGGVMWYSGRLEAPQFIPAGKGLYAIASASELASVNYRAARYRLL